MEKSFWRSGNTPTLIAAFLYFDLSFMVWVMLGPLGVQIAEDIGLTAAQKSMMVATPVLAVRCCALRWAHWWTICNRKPLGPLVK